MNIELENDKKIITSIILALIAGLSLRVLFPSDDSFVFWENNVEQIESTTDTTQINNDDRNYILQVEKAYRYYLKEEYQNANIEFEKAIEMQNDDTVLYYAAALSYYDEGLDYVKANEYAKKGLEHKKESRYAKIKNKNFENNELGLYTVLARSYRRLKQYDKALETYNFIIAEYNKENLYYERGKCYYFLCQYENAISDFYNYKSYMQRSIDSNESRYEHNDIEKIENWIKKANQKLK